MRAGTGGDLKAQQCGWLKDKHGLSWQIVPTVVQEMLKDHESPKAYRAMEAVMRMVYLHQETDASFVALE